MGPFKAFIQHYETGGAEVRLGGGAVGAEGAQGYSAMGGGCSLFNLLWGCRGCLGGLNKSLVHSIDHHGLLVGPLMTSNVYLTPVPSNFNRSFCDIGLRRRRKRQGRLFHNSALA
jgi:hypothetical protein